MRYAERLEQAYARSKSILMAGFDPRLETIPTWAWGNKQPSYEKIPAALKELIPVVVESLHQRVLAVKPNIAFFEVFGSLGVELLELLLSHSKKQTLITVVDGKRGDIGSTAEAYASAYLSNSQSPLSCDALTVNPFLGFDTLEPYVHACKENGKGIFVLLKTSNPGSSDIQDLSDSHGTVSEKIASWIQETSCKLCQNGELSPIGVVIGATYPEELEKFRKLLPEVPFLIPGFGAQGGKPEDIARAHIVGREGKFPGVLVNSSRGIFHDRDLLSSSSAEQYSERLIEVIERTNSELS